MKKKSILLKGVCVILLMLTTLYTPPKASAEPNDSIDVIVDAIRRITRLRTVGEDGLWLCHCYQTGYKCICVSPPPQEPDN